MVTLPPPSCGILPLVGYFSPLWGRKVNEGEKWLTRTEAQMPQIKIVNDNLKEH